jgi:hypothetical protein
LNASASKGFLGRGGVVEQKRDAPDRRSATVRLEPSEGAAELVIGEREKRGISAAAALTHEAPEALDLERVEVLPRGVRHDRRRWVLGESASGRLEHEERHARRFPVAAERPAQVATGGGRRGDRRPGDAEHEHRFAAQGLELGTNADGRPGRVRDQRLDAPRVGGRAMTRSRSDHPAVVVDPDEQRSALRVRQAHDRLDEVMVIGVLLELDGERLAAGDEVGESHRAFSLIGRCLARTCRPTKVMPC